MYCGSDIVVREAIQKASGPTQENYLGLTEFGLNEIFALGPCRGHGIDAIKIWKDKGNEVFSYCNKVLELDLKNPEAWYLKGMCSGMHLIFPEMRLNYQDAFQNAIKYANNENLKQEYLSKIVIGINKIVVNLVFKKVEYSCYENGTWHNDLHDYRLNTILPALEFAISLKPDELTTMKNLVRHYAENISYHDRHDRKSHISPKSTEIMNKYIEKIKN